MRKVTVGEPVIVAQSTSEPILFGGYQDPFIRCNALGELLVRFNTRRDCHETFGRETSNPVYKSTDAGETWEQIPNPLYSWITAQQPLPNGEYLEMREHSIVAELPELPPLPKNRENCVTIANISSVYLVDELTPVLGERVAKEFKAYRVLAGTGQVTEEICKVNWKNMPVRYFNNQDKAFLSRMFGRTYRMDNNGVLWMPVNGPYIDENGNLGSQYDCMHLLRSDDLGHTWDYVSTVVYREEYNDPRAVDVEGFSETVLEILDDGTLFCIMRSGSLHPFKPVDNSHPIPKLYFVKSSDGGKTWTEPAPFFDYGVFPVMVKLDCGTIVMASGRPGVYIRTTDDVHADIWNDVMPILSVPEEDVRKAYYEYTCSNTGICSYNANTAFITYSNFRLTDAHGQRAKSILVQKIVID